MRGTEPRPADQGLKKPRAATTALGRVSARLAIEEHHVSEGQPVPRRDGAKDPSPVLCQSEAKDDWHPLKAELPPAEFSRGPRSISAKYRSLMVAREERRYLLAASFKGIEAPRARSK